MVRAYTHSVHLHSGLQASAPVAEWHPHAPRGRAVGAVQGPVHQDPRRAQSLRASL